MTKAALISRNIKVSGKRTSMRLEEEMWSSLKDIASYEGCTVGQVCSLVAIEKRPELSLTAAIRVFLMLYYKRAMTEEGRLRSHGYLRTAIMKANDNNLIDACLRHDL